MFRRSARIVRRAQAQSRSRSKGLPFLIGVLIFAAVLVRSGMERVNIPPLVAFIAIRVLLSLADARWAIGVALTATSVGVSVSVWSSAGAMSRLS